MDGWYYLHTGGDLIWKAEPYTDAGDFRESDFVVAFWPYRPGDREQAWTTLVEALAAGANDRRVAELAAQWGCDDTDAAEYCSRINVTAAREGDGWLVVPERQSSDLPPAVPVGRGATVLDALAALARAAGWQPAKLRGRSFPVLLHTDLATKEVTR